MPTDLEGCSLADLKTIIYRLESENEDLRRRLNSGTPERHRLPDTRQAYTHKFDIMGHEGYITVGMYEDGSPGEMFISMAKEGSTLGGLMDAIATLVSLALQYGIPTDVLVRKLSNARFEPSGMTKNPDIRHAKSITDYIFKWFGITFIPGYREQELRLPPVEQQVIASSPPTSTSPPKPPALTDWPKTVECTTCGSQAPRNGSCYKCLNCSAIMAPA